MVSVPLNSTITSKNGSFELLFTDPLVQELLKRQPTIFFKIYQEDELLMGGHSDKIWQVDEFLEEVSFEVGLVGEKSGGKDNRTLQGIVSDAQGKPVHDVRVIAFDRLMRGEKKLGESTTDRFGKYLVRYSAATVKREGEEKADILVKVYSNEKKLLYQSGLNDILFNAPQHARFNISLTETPGPKPSEFTIYQETIARVAGNVAFDQLEESTNNRDITFLSKQTGLDFTFLEYFSLAFKVKKQFGIGPAITYAILREGSLQGADLGKLLNMRPIITIDTDVTGLVYDMALLPAEQITTAVENAKKQNVISRAEEELPAALKILAKLQPAANEYVRNERPQQWLNMAAQALSSGQYKQIVDVLSKNYYGNLPALFNGILGANPFVNNNSAKNAAAVNLQMGSLMGTDSDLIQQVKKAAGIKKEDDLKKLAALSPEDWEGLLNNISDKAVKQRIAPNKQKAKANAAILHQQFSRKYPHAAFVSQFEKDDKHLYQNKSLVLDALAKTRDADLGGKPIDTQLKGLKVDEDTKKELRKMQRLYKIAPEYAKTKVLQADKINSSHQIVALGEKQFVKKYTKNNTFTEAEAKKVYQKASATHTAAMLLGGELRDLASTAKHKMLGGEIVAPLLEPVVKDFPNLKSLFQDTDLCACEDCRSVYGPAAYMVDVLQFLGNRLLTDGTKSAKDVLFSRRPDLGNLDLNCDNAMVPLPYIDLVCEILEEQVWPDQGLALDSTYTVDMVEGTITAHLFNQLASNNFNITASAIIYPSYQEGTVTTFMLRDAKCTIKISANGTGWTVKELKQTHLSAAELSACPEYINTNAYDTLQTSDISFSLPFDLYQQEGGALLETVGVERAGLMDIFQVPAGLTASQIAAVALGISPAEAGLICNADTANQYVYWNTTAAALLTTVNEVDVFLAKSQLTYEQLQDLLGLSFINPTGDIYIHHEDSSCDTSKKLIENLDEAALDRIHRFLRLWRRVGGTMTGLDHLVTYTNLGKGAINPDTLSLISDLNQLQSAIGITAEQSLSFYGLMPADTDTSLYQSVYLNHIVTNPVDPAFKIPQIINNEGLPAVSQDTLSAHMPSLILCLKRSATEVQFLIDQLKAALGVEPPLTRDNLAFLYRYSVLARKLGMKLPDMLTFSTLCAKALFDTPEGTNGFISAARYLQSSGFTLADLQWFLQNIGPATLTLPDTTVATFLTTLQTALQAAYDANVSPFDPTATSDTNQNGLKQLLGNLPAVGPSDLNKVISIISGTYNDAVLTPQNYIQNLLGQYFDTTDIQAKVTALLASAPANVEASRNDLVQSLDDSIATYLYTLAKTTALYAAVESKFGTSDVVTQVILNNAALKNPPPGSGNPPTLLALLTDDAFVDMVNTPAQPPVVALPAFDLQFRAVRVLNLVVSYANRINVPANNLQWFLQNNAAMGWLELDNLAYQTGVPAVDYSKWYKFQQALQLMAQYGTVQNPDDPTSTLSWIDVWGQLVSGAGKPAMFATMVLFTGWDPSALSDLDAYFAYTYPGASVQPYTTSFGDPATYIQLDQATASLRLLGLALGDMQQVIKPVLGAPDVQLIVNTLRNKYDEDQWLNIIKPVQDALRPQKRDALVAYLLAKNTDLTGSDDLYDYFLVDVEMQAAQQSSRIVLAHGTLQLFVQRCLMALEPTAIADVTNDDGWSQWSWMENFQVWVANRKIFLYPENWFYPELRTGKSYFFSDLMSDLQQNQVTDDNVETATLTYLEKLDDVATLDVRACYYDITGGKYTFHVVARVKGGSTYYYRTCVKERSWTAWTKVNVDISGDHLITFVRNSRLFLAWPIFTEDTQQSQSLTVPTAGSTSPTPTPSKRYKVQLATSEYANGTWQPKRTSQDYLYTDYYPNQYNPDLTLASLKDGFSMINFDLGALGDNILCTFNNETIGTFSLTGCKGYPEPVSWNPEALPSFKIIPVFEDTDFLQQQYREKAGQVGKPFTAKTIFNPFTDVNILDVTPSAFKITYPHEFSLIDWVVFGIEVLTIASKGFGIDEFGRKLVLPMASFMPFFYADNDRSYVIIPGWFEDAGNEKTFSDIYQFLLDVIALLKKYIQLYLADPGQDMAAFVAAFKADKETIRLDGQWQIYSTNQPQFMFRNFYHPLVCYIKSSVYSNGLGSIMSYDFQSKQGSFNFQGTYSPEAVVANENFPNAPTNYPVEDIDFSAEGSYSLYNWELFFHLPYFVANQLSQNQQFADALKWYQYIFNPTGAQGGTAPQKYWITRPFHEFVSTGPNDVYVLQRIDTILTDIAADPSGANTGDLVTAVNNWRSQPFMPDVVAQTRPVAYQKALLMSYINNLIAWGDNLFTQNTTESKVQATSLYVMADRLLGPEPLIVPPAVPVPDETYNQLSASIDTFGNALIDLENLVPDLNILPHKGAELPSPPTSLGMLYFCIPDNANMLSLWGTVADRLYKVRNCEDIDGNPSFTPLFAPPIDPGMLVRAAAAGLDISSVLSMLNAPLPVYKFRTMVAKAIEVGQEVNNLGSALLAALEKKDAEVLNQLRSGQEISLQKQVLAIRQTQITEADQSIVELKKTLAISQAKHNYYTSRDFMNAWEITQAAISAGAIISEVVGTVLDATSGGTYMIPIITGGGAGFGGSPVITVSEGGSNIGGGTAQFATMFRAIAGILQSTAGLIGNIGSYQRRMDEWDFQGGLASLEMDQINQQIVVAGIRKDIATQEAATQQTRIDQAIAVDTAIKTKYTNKDLYNWMISQISGVYYQSYQLAVSLAQKAEQCYRYELARESNFIQFGYWDTMHKGLLAGEQLLKDLRKMESSYLDVNKREYELTKNISVASLDPRALLQLQNTGMCDIEIPEILFDMDYPGQYLRRIKSVSLTIPSVAGPLTTIACTLTLVNNKYRQNSLLAGGSDPYAEIAGGDDRFIYNIGFVQSIATSSGQNDSGVFQLDLNDERYLPFEGVGAISSWHLEMNNPSVLAQFDYQSISDVIIQLKYTARQGGGALKTAATASLTNTLKTIADNVPAAGLFKVFNLKHDCPNNWYAFNTDGTGTFNLDISKVNFPFYAQGNSVKVSIQSAALYVLTTDGSAVSLQYPGTPTPAPVPLIKNAATFGNNIQFIDPVAGFTADLKLSTDTATISLPFSNFATIKGKISNAWIILNYDIAV